MSVSGAIRADGVTPPPYGGSYNGGGGGAGGSIYMVVGALAGAGSISANGGGGAVGAGNGSGGGGGGRVSMTVSSLTFSGTSSTTAGASGGGGGSASGSDGSVYVLLVNQPPSSPSGLGQPVLVTGSTTGTNNPVFTFNLSDPDVSDTEQYRIQIDNDSDFSSPVVDYTSALGAQGTRTFQVGQALGGGLYTVGSSGQTLADGSYYWQVQAIDAAAAASSYVRANGGAIAFHVDTAPRTIQFAQATASALESVTATSVRIVLNTAHFETVTVNYAVTGGTATGGGVDYTLASGTATLNPGETSTTIPLTIVNDSVDEPDETIIVSLSSPVFSSLGSNSTHTYTITDNDTAGVTVAESSGSTAVTEGGSTDSYTVVLTSQPTSTVRVAFTTSTLGVTLDQDHVDFTSGNWDTPQTVTVTATNDQVAEGPHTSAISFAVSVPSGYAYGYSASPPAVSDITASITDNDTAGVTVSASSLSLAEGGPTGSYTLVLTSAPTTTVTIVPSVSGLASVSPASLSFTSSTWSTPQTITVAATDDSIAQGTHTATIGHTISSTAYGYSSLTLGNVSVSIADNDVAATGGGASTANSGSAASIGIPVTWTFTAPISTTAPVSGPVTSGPVSSSPTVSPSPVPVPLSPAPLPPPASPRPITLSPPPASLRLGDTLRFTYSYTNPTTRPQPVTIIRELVDTRGRVVRTSRTSTTLRAGASFSRTVGERVTSRAGAYTERVRVMDRRGRVLETVGFPLTVVAPAGRR